MMLGQIWYFGGAVDDRKLLGDLFYYDVEETLWVTPNTQGTKPAPRCSHTVGWLPGAEMNAECVCGATRQDSSGWWIRWERSTIRGGVFASDILALTQRSDRHPRDGKLDLGDPSDPWNPTMSSV